MNLSEIETKLAIWYGDLKDFFFSLKKEAQAKWKVRTNSLRREKKKKTTSLRQKKKKKPPSLFAYLWEELLDDTLGWTP